MEEHSEFLDLLLELHNEYQIPCENVRLPAVEEPRGTTACIEERIPTTVFDEDASEWNMDSDSSLMSDDSNPNSRLQIPSTFEFADRQSFDSTPTEHQTTVKIRKPRKQKQIWQFLLDILNSPDYNPNYIRWIDRKDGIFKFVQSQKVAQLWGSGRSKREMKYEHFSRGMRYYYQQGIMKRVQGKRLEYQFVIPDWQTYVMN